MVAGIHLRIGTLRALFGRHVDGEPRETSEDWSQSGFLAAAGSIPDDGGLSAGSSVGSSGVEAALSPEAGIPVGPPIE